MSLLPKHFLNAVVLIEEQETSGQTKPIATGFLAGFHRGEFDDKKNKIYRIYLVTNRHVFEGRKLVFLRFNLARATGSKRFPLGLEDTGGKVLWFAHPNPKVDIATVSINVKLLQNENIQYAFFPDDLMAFKDTIESQGITQGDEVFVLGFPLGIAGEERNYVIVRSGIIARLDNEIVNKHFEFLIDSFVFPGNSGGPVVLKPSIASIEGTTPVNQAYLLGVVKDYIPYEDTAISIQTKKPRIVFIENSGLAGVVPMDFVKETLEHFLNTVKQERDKETIKS